MTTVKEVIDIASKEIGTAESPPYSNKVKYNTWYYGREVSGTGYAWCMVFCQWVYDKAKVKLPSRTASCTGMLDAAKKSGMLVVKDFKPGDLLLYNFEGKNTFSTHCGILKEVDGSRLIAIEGNTGLVNDVDGGAVMLRERKVKSVIGAVRLKLEREEEIDMTKTEFLKSLTDEEAYLLLSKATSYANKLKEPDWSKKEGSWSKAIKAKIFKEDTPEAPIKRDEVAAILDRLGLIK